MNASFLDAVDDDRPNMSARVAKHNRRQTEMRSTLLALPKEALIEIMMDSVSHNIGGGGGSVTWLQRRASEEKARLPLPEVVEAAIRAANDAGPSSAGSSLNAGGSGAGSSNACGSGAGSSGAGSLSTGSSGMSVSPHPEPAWVDPSFELFSQRVAERAGEQRRGVKVGLRVFRGFTQDGPVAGKVVSVPESEEGDAFGVRWGVGKWPYVRYTGASETLTLAALKNLTWHQPPKAPPGLPSGDASSWTLLFFQSQIDELERREKVAGLVEPGRGVMMCLLLTPAVMDAIQLLHDVHPPMGAGMCQVGLSRDASGQKVLLHHCDPIGDGEVEPAAIELPASDVRLYVRSPNGAAAGNVYQHLVPKPPRHLPSSPSPPLTASSTMWRFFSSIALCKPPKPTAGAQHCFSILTLYRKVVEAVPVTPNAPPPPPALGPVQTVQRLTHVFRPPPATLLLVAWVCRAHGVGSDVARHIAAAMLNCVRQDSRNFSYEYPNLMRPVLAPPPPTAESGEARKAPYSDAVALPRYRLLPSHEASHVRIDLPGSVLKQLAMHMEAVKGVNHLHLFGSALMYIRIRDAATLFERPYEGDSMVAGNGTLPANAAPYTAPEGPSPPMAIRITFVMLPDEVDLSCKATLTCAINDEEDATKPKVCWPTNWQGPKDFTVTINLSSDSSGVTYMLHNAQRKLAWTQGATLYLPMMSASLASLHSRAAVLHAHMAKGGKLLAAAPVY